MERFFILSFASGKSEAVFEMVDGALHSSSGFISIIPFGSPTQGAGICPQVFFRIDVNHSPARGGSTGVFALADTVVLSSRSVLFPPDFGTGEFITNNATPEFTGAFMFHRKGSIGWATGDAVLVYRIIHIFKSCPGI